MMIFFTLFLLFSWIIFDKINTIIVSLHLIHTCTAIYNRLLATLKKFYPGDEANGLLVRTCMSGSLELYGTKDASDSYLVMSACCVHACRHCST